MALWSVDTRDWANQNASRIAHAALAGLDQTHPIVLMHDGGGDRQNTVAALDRIIAWYQARGYVFTDPAGRPFQDGPAVGSSGSAERSGGTYTVRPGDTLSAIGARFGVEWHQVYAANRTAIGPDPSYLRVGQQLTVRGADPETPSAGSSPGSTAGSRYTVRAGDTLSGIAAGSGTAWQQLYAANRTAIGPDPADLRVGQQLIIPRR